MRKIIFITLFFTMSLFAQSINVALAANVSYTIDDLIKEFNKDYPHIKVNTIIGSSGKLTAQIVNGAPFDIFMSADMKYPRYLYDHLATIDKPVVYAKGSLVLLTTRENQDLSKFFGILTSKKIKKIALANPKTAPYGKATKTVLEMMKIYDKIEKKFVFGESISQTVFYTTKVADVGFIAKSALYSSKMKKYKENINWVEVSKDFYNPIEQGIVALKRTKNQESTMKFYDFILSKKAKKIFGQYGYTN